MDSIFEENILPMAIISDSTRIRIMLDETRLKILRIMRRGIQREGDPKVSQSFTVAEIAGRMNTSPQRIYHHVDKLVEHDFLRKSGEIKKKRSIISFYQRTAHGFVINYDADPDGPIEQIDEVHIKFINNLTKTFGIELQENEKSKLTVILADLLSKESEIFKRLNDKIVSTCATDGEFFPLMKFLQLIISINDEEMLNLYKQIAEILIDKSYL